MPTSWPGLFADVDRMDLSRRRLAAAQAEFEGWASLTESRAIAAVRSLASQRAAELCHRTAVRVIVEPASSSRRALGGRPRVGLLLGSSRVDVYSVREPASAPCLYLGVQRGATSTRSPVFTTITGALLVRRADDGFDALCLPALAGRALTSIDALVLRAFELLVATHRSTLNG